MYGASRVFQHGKTDTILFERDTGAFLLCFHVGYYTIVSFFRENPSVRKQERIPISGDNLLDRERFCFSAKIVVISQSG